MNSEALRALAEKLGISVDHLWQVLVRQAFLDGVSSSFTCLFCLLAATAAIYFERKYRAKFAKFTEYFPTQLLLFLLLVLVLMVFSSNFYWALSDFTNPEYYAFRQLPFTRR
jgi:hypothetical protein